MRTIGVTAGAKCNRNGCKGFMIDGGSESCVCCNEGQPLCICRTPVLHCRTCGATNKGKGYKLFSRGDVCFLSPIRMK